MLGEKDLRQHSSVKTNNCTIQQQNTICKCYWLSRRILCFACTIQNQAENPFNQTECRIAGGNVEQSQWQWFSCFFPHSELKSSQHIYRVHFESWNCFSPAAVVIAGMASCGLICLDPVSQTPRQKPFKLRHNNYMLFLLLSPSPL